MGLNGDFEFGVIETPGVTYTPSFEGGAKWATQYSSELVGTLALSQSLIGPFASNFITRDIAGRTEGICVNAWDFNFVKTNRIDGGAVGRPEDYSRTSYTPCDCSYHKCDRDFQQMEYSVNFNTLWNEGGLGEGGVFESLDPAYDTNSNYRRPAFYQLGLPVGALDGGFEITGTIPEETFQTYRSGLANYADGLVLGNKSNSLFTYACIDICGGSITLGVQLKNNIMSALAFSADTYVIDGDIDYGGDFENGGGDFTGVANGIVANYAQLYAVPGFTYGLVYAVLPGTDGIQEYCMCLDGGMHGLDAYPFADYRLVEDQLTVDFAGNGGIENLNLFGFEGTTLDLATYFTIDGADLKTKGVTNARPYKYGPNWAYGYGFGELNVVALGIPAFKNWEARDSGKMRISGFPNGEPYSFGRQWLEWGQRVGIPAAEVLAVSPISIEGGDFVDPNFGYRGKLEGTLIYRGRLPSDVLSYEDQEYEFAFSGITTGSLGGGFNTNFWLGLTTIRHDDGLNNQEAYGTGGSIEDIVFSENFSESPQDKTIYRL
jgi:hypothetical protein